MKKFIAIFMLTSMIIVSGMPVYGGVSPMLVHKQAEVVVNSPVINRNDLNYYPFEDVIRGLGGTLTFDSVTQKYIGEYKNREVILLGDELTVLTSSGESIVKNSFTVDGIKYVSIRDICDALNMRIDIYGKNLILTDNVEIENKVPEEKQIALTIDELYTSKGKVYVDDTKKQRLYADIDGFYKPKSQLTGVVDAEAINVEDIENEMIRLINEDRKEAGLHELTKNKELNTGARVRAKELETSYSHIRPNGEKHWTAVENSVMIKKGIGENIWGAPYGTYYDAKSAALFAHTCFKNSPGHYENYMRSDCTEIGVGAYLTHKAGRPSFYISELFMR